MNPHRLIEIETKLSFQEEAIQSLNDVVTRQQKQIEHLEGAMELLIKRYRQLAEAPPSPKPPTHEIPPHY